MSNPIMPFDAPGFNPTVGNASNIQDVAGAVDEEIPFQNLQWDTVFTDQNLSPGIGLDMSEVMSFDDEGATNVENPSQILPTPEPPSCCQPSLKRKRKQEADKRYRDKQKQKMIDLKNKVDMLTNENKRVNKKYARLKKSKTQWKQEVNRLTQELNRSKSVINERNADLNRDKRLINQRNAEIHKLRQELNRNKRLVNKENAEIHKFYTELVMNQVASQICNDPNHRAVVGPFVGNGSANQTNVSNRQD